MAAIANTFQTYQTKGIREDLSDVISNISPTETPTQSNAGMGKAPNQTFYEWQLDSLVAADNTNARIEGDDKTAFDAVVPTVRVGNYTQISDKTLILSGTNMRITKKAGRKSDKAMQIAKKGKELKRDVEKIACGTNQGAAAGATATARNTATLLSYIRTNTVKQTGGTPSGADPAAPSPAYSGTRTDNSATAAFTETMLKTAISAGYTSGMQIDGASLMVDPVQKGTVSAFSGIATKTFQQTQAKTSVIVGAADVYVSDFGVITVIPNRFQRHRDAFLLDWELIKFRDLRPYEVQPLAKTGDADKSLLLREWSLYVENEAGLAGIFDLT